MKKVGLALGAGGARGLAHIKILEAFDELGIKPCIISGTSIGAIIGAAYASGISAHEIEKKVRNLLAKKDSKIWDFYKNSEIKLLFSLVDFESNSGGFIKGDKFQKYFESEVPAKDFNELEIPLKVVATSYWERKEKIFQSGDLFPAIRSSYSLPGLFSPQEIEGNLFVDGGMVNPLPYDLIIDECDLTVAIDVGAPVNGADNETPPFYEILFSSFQIMQNSILNSKLKFSRPDILIKTEIKNIRMLEFSKIDEIFQQAELYKAKLLKKLKKLI